MNRSASLTWLEMPKMFFNIASFGYFAFNVESPRLSVCKSRSTNFHSSQSCKYIATVFPYERNNHRPKRGRKNSSIGPSFQDLAQ